jgi:transposase
MTKATRKLYTLEFKQEAVRLVESGQSLASAARTLGIVEQTLGNWVKAQRTGSLQGASGKASVSAEQMENRRLRSELARVERLYGQRFETIREAKDETIAWLLWYNQTRMHSTLGYVSPIEFEQDWKEAAIKIAA